MTVEDQLDDVPFTYFSQSAPSSSLAEIQTRAGGKLTDAVVLAARAHSMLSPSETREVVLAFGGGAYGPASLVNALEIAEKVRPIESLTASA